MRWVLGDIHGMLKPLEAIIASLRAQDDDPRFYFVGDYVNRGPESRGVVDYLLSLADARFARGNHDDVLDLILNDRWLGGNDTRLNPRSACEWFHSHGLAQTLASYGLTKAEINECRRGATDETIDAIRAAVPATHRAFFRELPLTVEEDDLLVAHAYWPPAIANDASSLAWHLAADPGLAHKLVWHRWQVAEIIDDKPTWTRPAFFGHTPTMNYSPAIRDDDAGPIFGPRITLLDTAAALGPDGRLTAVCVENGAVVQVDRRGHSINL